MKPAPPKEEEYFPSSRILSEEINMKLPGNSPSQADPQWRGDSTKRPLPVDEELASSAGSATTGAPDAVDQQGRSNSRSFPEKGSPSKRSKPNEEDEDAEDARLRQNEIDRRRCASRESSRRTRERERRRFDYFSSTKYKLEDANARIRIENQRLRSLIQLLKHTKATIITGENHLSAPRFQIPTKQQQQQATHPSTSTTTSSSPPNPPAGAATNANQMLQMSNFMGNSVPQQANIPNDLLKLLLQHQSKSNAPSSKSNTSSSHGGVGGAASPMMPPPSTRPTTTPPTMQQKQSQDLSSLLSSPLINQLMGPNKVDRTSGATSTTTQQQQPLPAFAGLGQLDINRQLLEQLKRSGAAGFPGGAGGSGGGAPVPLAPPPLWGNGGLL
eukprot:Nitzschia sp. Nitz4//scaffold72_size95085//41510//42667//NITZ4_004756-RA/size95085-processed-gene-0.23-mRNA-1//-1//CDS//3329557363//4685//frame0